jgi:hypothetical protein
MAEAKDEGWGVYYVTYTGKFKRAPSGVRSLVDGL